MTLFHVHNGQTSNKDDKGNILETMQPCSHTANKNNDKHNRPGKYMIESYPS